jgi:hypothetical protein
LAKRETDGKGHRGQLEKVLADTLKLQADIKQRMATAEGEMGKARTRLRNFELLANDNQYGKYYTSHIEHQRFLIEQCQKQIVASESRLAKLDQIISKLLTLRDKL